MPALDWMQEGPFGIMVHWVSQITSRPGEPELNTWDEAVDHFSVERFCDEMESTGAGWVIWPFSHGEGKSCAPNSILEQYVPGCCSKRDLFGELAENLTQRGIRMMAYMPTNACGDEIPDAMGWNDDPSDKREFQKKYAEVVREWSERYGTLISGWWFDCCYQGPRTQFTWDETRFEGSGWGEAVRAGNPDSVYCMNPGANTFQYVFEDEGFLAGEANNLKVRPGRPLIGDKQWHSLLWIDCTWFHTDQDKTIDPPRYYDNELHEYLYTCRRNGGGVTLNMGIYRDGSLAEDSLAQLQRMGALMKAGTKPKPLHRGRRLYN